MATLREYFKSDFSRLLSLSKPWTLSSSGLNIEILIHVHLDFDSNTKFISCYISETSNLIEIFAAIVNNLGNILAIEKEVEVGVGFQSEGVLKSGDLNFSGRIFFYCETQIDATIYEKVKSELKEKGLYIHFRGPEYVAERSSFEKPQAFISHDSRDEDKYAQPIASGLSKFRCFVWYDEYSLKVGDRLRESIENGIKECKKCVLVLSPNFLLNSGWTKTEFNSIFTCELIKERDLILPVWCGITKKELFEYSPTLADRLGINFDKGIDEVVRKLYRSITFKPKE